MHAVRCAVLVAFMAFVAAGCESDVEYVERPPAPADETIHNVASGCFTVDATEPGSSNTRWLAASVDGTRYAFSEKTPDTAARFRLRASDLGTYLLYDQDRHYVVADNG